MRGIHIFAFLGSSAALAIGQSQTGFAVDFVVPTDSSAQDGDTSSFIPFIAESIRYQQVYAASEFAALTNSGGGWLVNILFRGDATNGTSFGVKIPNLRVNFSTTTRGPDNLRPSFAENVGTDDTSVFVGYLETIGIGGHPPGPETFSFWIQLTGLFFYDPTRGNLLMDVRIAQGNTNISSPPRLDAWNRTNDSVSRVWWGDVNASTGLADTVGLVTEFNVWPNPSLAVQQRTNAVILTWPANPPTVAVLPETVLQTKKEVSAPVQWQTITNGIVTSNLVNTYTIPLESEGAAAYFRLVSTTPP